MTTTDRVNATQLVNYWETLADDSHNLSLRKDIAQFASGFSAGMSAARKECAEQLTQWIESGDIEISADGDASLSYDGEDSCTGSVVDPKPRKMMRRSGRRCRG